MSEPSIGVALATCNGASFVIGLVDSLVRQTHRPDQVVVADDASTDGTGEAAVERLRGEGIHAVLIRQARRVGLERNFSTALEAVTADVVFLADQDDVWHSEKIARHVKLHERFPASGMVLSDATLINERGATIPGGTLWARLGFQPSTVDGLLGSRDMLASMLRRTPVFGCTVSLQRWVLDAGLPIEPGWGQDNWLALVAVAGGSVVVEPRALTGYRQHAAQASGGAGGIRQAPLATNLVRAATIFERLSETLVMRTAGSPERFPEVLHVERMLWAKAEHLRRRSELPRRRLRRVGPVLRELRAGGYTRYSNGGISAAWDAIRREPAPVE